MAAKQHVLVTTDFSEGSKCAFSHVKDYIELGGKENVKCTVLTVIEDLTTGTQFKLAGALIEGHGIDDEMLKETEQQLKQAKEENFKGYDVDTVVLKAKSKEVHSQILDWAEKNGVTRIVTATHGRTGVAHVFLGSVTEQIIRYSKIPVLVVPVPKEEEKASS